MINLLKILTGRMLSSAEMRLFKTKKHSFDYNKGKMLVKYHFEPNEEGATVVKKTFSMDRISKITVSRYNDKGMLTERTLETYSKEGFEWSRTFLYSPPGSFIGVQQRRRS